MLCVAALPSFSVVTATVVPPVPAPVICGTSVPTNVPPNVIVNVVPLCTATTEPPAPPMLESAFSAACTSAAVAAADSCAVVCPLKVSENDPLPRAAEREPLDFPIGAGDRAGVRRRAEAEGRLAGAAAGERQAIAGAGRSARRR